MKLFFKRIISIQSVLKKNLCFNRIISTTSSNNPYEFTLYDIGKYYSVPMDVAKILQFEKNLTIRYIKQLRSFNECFWLCREQLLNAINCLKNVSQDRPSLRIVLWGQFGTGKSLTLQQLIHVAHTQDFVTIAEKNVMKWTRLLRDVQNSSYKEGRIDTPYHANKILENFKHINQTRWSKLAKLKIERTYSWSKVESTSSEKSIVDIVEMGLSAPYLASDCVGALCRELKRHASSGEIRLLVALDQANSLYGEKTIIKKQNKQFAKPEELTIVHNFKKFFLDDWTNGICILVADKAEISNARDRITVPLNTPIELFGEKGFNAIDPFIPIETKLYTMDEVNAVYEYFIEKNWITNEKAKSNEGRDQLAYLSAFNPHYYDKLCAIN